MGPLILDPGTDCDVFGWLNSVTSPHSTQDISWVERAPVCVGGWGLEGVDLNHSFILSSASLFSLKWIFRLYYLVLIKLTLTKEQVA